MKKNVVRMMKKGIIVALSMMLIIESNVSAADVNYQYQLDSEDEINTMTDEELNEYIHTIREKIECQGESAVMTLSSSPSEIQLAWKAAAQILINNGYSCAGALLGAAANKVSYYNEYYGGIFETTIKGTKKYKNFLSSVQGLSKSDEIGVTYTMNGNTDLFLALHKCTMSSVGSLVNTSFATYTITVKDTYDFALMLNNSNYENTFVSLVNDAAWLSTQTGHLSTFPVNIVFLA